MWGGDTNLRISRIVTRKDRGPQSKEPPEILNPLRSIQAREWLLGKGLCFGMKGIVVGWYS